MGLDSHALRFMLEARATGLSFDDVLTLGRLGVHAAPEPLQSTLEGAGIAISLAETETLLTSAAGFCEPLLTRLGARTIASIDISAYQHAAIVHDMNRPLPVDLHQRFSLVIDGGTLEHVFHFPHAVAGCMQAVRPGGHFVAVSPANNFMGHGFYQFSPELFFRVLCPENGFVVERMVIYEDQWPSEWYEVRDPAAVGQRVTLVNRYPTFLLVLARKTEHVPLFRTFPQQSDYVDWWSTAERDRARPAVRSSGTRKRSLGQRLLDGMLAPVRLIVPAAWKSRYHHVRAGGNRFNPASYRKVARSSP
jgi:SAM-dependent methyltransferase